ncbi:MAG: divergent PAP2 family protein, partial [Alicyclobacillus sp.]|nr:divergent PAP2 family protein [Alicyclobacillus sp.]
MIRDSAYIWIGPLVAMVVAQILKPLIIMIRLRRWDWQRMRQSGGMPSAHSALVTALVTELWLREGGQNVVLAIAVFMAMVVMYDAAGVRWQTGRQAAVLNRLLHDLQGRGHLLRPAVGAPPPDGGSAAAEAADAGQAGGTGQAAGAGQAGGTEDTGGTGQAGGVSGVQPAAGRVGAALANGRGVPSSGGGQAPDQNGVSNFPA